MEPGQKLPSSCPRNVRDVHRALLRQQKRGRAVVGIRGNQRKTLGGVSKVKPELGEGGEREGRDVLGRGKSVSESSDLRNSMAHARATSWLVMLNL